LKTRNPGLSEAILSAFAAYASRQLIERAMTPDSARSRMIRFCLLDYLILRNQRFTFLSHIARVAECNKDYVSMQASHFLQAFSGFKTPGLIGRTEKKGAKARSGLGRVRENRTCQVETGPT
jgi:hypothetical protein